MTAILALVPSWVWLGLVAALGVSTCTLNGQLADTRVDLANQVSATERVKGEHQAALADAALERAAKVELARSVENQVAALAADMKEKSDAKISSIGAERDALIVRLRDANRKAAGADPRNVPTATGLAQNLPVGAELAGTLVPRQIDETDVDEFARAEMIRVRLIECYANEDAYRRAVEKAYPG